MASQSSAVLDMSDCDVTDDTDAPSVSDDAEVPLIMEPPYDIAVKVDSPMKQLSTLETFVTYRVRCVCARWPTPRHVRRRYNQFKELHRRLTASHPWVVVPALPALHSAAQQLDRYAPTFVSNRAHSLHALLDQIAKHPILTHSEHFKIFITTPDDQMDKIFRNENRAMNLWGLGSVLYGNSDSKPTNGARVKDPELSAASDYLSSLQNKLSTLLTLTDKLYKGTNDLGHELLGMKRACDTWSCQACRAGRGGALGALGAGAGRGGAVLRGAPAPPHRALLALTATTAQAHVHLLDKRAALHAEYVAGNSSSSELHNRLEQATESIRSELSHWLPKTRKDIRSILLDLAEKQVNIHAQMFNNWEQALKLATNANVEELFKTVSKNAVQNLSPSKCRSFQDGENSDIPSNSYIPPNSDSNVPSNGNNIPSNGSYIPSNSSNIPSNCDVPTNSDSVVESEVNSEHNKISDPLQSFSDVDLSS